MYANTKHFLRCTNILLSYRYIDYFYITFTYFSFFKNKKT